MEKEMRKIIPPRHRAEMVEFERWSREAHRKLAIRCVEIFRRNRHKVDGMAEYNRLNRNVYGYWSGYGFLEGLYRDGEPDGIHVHGEER